MATGYLFYINELTLMISRIFKIFPPNFNKKSSAIARKKVKKMFLSVMNDINSFTNFLAFFMEILHIFSTPN